MGCQLYSSVNKNNQLSKCYLSVSQNQPIWKSQCHVLCVPGYSNSFFFFFLNWSIVAVQYYISYRYTIWQFPIFKGYAPFIVINSDSFLVCIFFILSFLLPDYWFLLYLVKEYDQLCISQMELSLVLHIT